MVSRRTRELSTARRGVSRLMLSRSCSYGFEIRQFHEVRVAGSNIPEEDPHNDAYTLGQFPVPVAREAPKYGSGSSSLATKDAKIPATLGGGSDVGFGWDDGGRYLSQTWDDGTLCDKTGMPRLTEVQVSLSARCRGPAFFFRSTVSDVHLWHTVPLQHAVHRPDRAHPRDSQCVCSDSVLSLYAFKSDSVLDPPSLPLRHDYPHSPALQRSRLSRRARHFARSCVRHRVPSRRKEAS